LNCKLQKNWTVNSLVPLSMLDDNVYVLDPIALQKIQSFTKKYKKNTQQKSHLWHFTCSFISLFIHNNTQYFCICLLLFIYSIRHIIKQKANLFDIDSPSQPIARLVIKRSSDLNPDNIDFISPTHCWTHHPFTLCSSKRPHWDGYWFSDRLVPHAREWRHIYETQLTEQRQRSIHSTTTAEIICQHTYTELQLNGNEWELFLIGNNCRVFVDKQISCCVCPWQVICG